MNFAEYQRRAHATDEGKRLGLSVSGLVGEVGSIVSTYKKLLLYRRNFPNFKREMAEELGNTPWYLSSVATLSGLSLNEIAEANLRKANSLFDEGERPWFDQRYPADEQFPRQFEVLFTEKVERQKAEGWQFILVGAGLDTYRWLAPSASMSNDRSDSARRVRRR